MEVNQALERLLSAQPENILQQLLVFNVMIQQADESTTIALWHMLESAKTMVISGNSASQNIYELQKSIKSRMKVLAFESGFTERIRGEKKMLFETIVGPF